MSTAPLVSTRAVPWRVGAAEPTGFAVALALLGAVLVAAPVLSVLTSFIQAPQSGATLAHLAQYVIPRASYETLCLALLVGAGVAVLGTTSAWLVVAHEFPGRRMFEWAMLLPLAMPGYIVAYAYTDFLQFAGPVQGGLRELFGWQRTDYWFPEIRSLPGAAFVFTVVLYPYVYLLARTAFLGRTASMIDAARCLGYTPWRTWLHVNLPLARPAIAAGTLLALMETLADYGAAAYFGLLTYTTAIYRAWFALGDRMAASQLAAVLLTVVLGLMLAERRARGRARFFVAPQSNRPAPPTVLRGAPAWMATAACCIPIALGFVLPVALLLRLFVPVADTVNWSRYLQWLQHSLLLGVGAAMLTVFAALLVAYAVRLATRGLAERAARAAAAIMGLGYAVPGMVIAVGILVPLAGFDNLLDAALRRAIGAGTGLLFTGTLIALLYALLVRYFAVAYQPIESGLSRITPAMDASARSLGARPYEAFRRVHLPLLAPSVLAGALLVFVDTLKELPATLVLRPFNFDTLAVIAYQLAADERLGESALPALTIVAAGIVPVIALSRAIGHAAQPAR
jgi:iron(III) transport system permease protein